MHSLQTQILDCETCYRLYSLSIISCFVNILSLPQFNLVWQTVYSTSSTTAENFPSGQLIYAVHVSLMWNMSCLLPEPVWMTGDTRRMQYAVPPLWL